ncbi:MAG: TIGR00725 family protein [Candidatus Thorarchaeota archaeon]|nr:MAG: TIGR00725 family protein [Candidatus Thorarchaeota archaeon]
MPSRIISVIGGAESSSETLKLAEDIGAEIAKRGIALACGGLMGVMEAACRGAKKHDGVTIGILPSDFKQDANEYVDYAIPTGLGYTRNFLVVKTGDAVIAIDGSAGTLSEIAIAWFSDKPIVALASSGGWAEELAGKRIDNRRTDEVFSASTPQEALDIIFRELGWE